MLQRTYGRIEHAGSTVQRPLLRCYDDLGAYAISVSPVDNHGVVMFVQYAGRNQRKVFLSRHASSARADTNPPTSLTRLRTN